MLKLRHVRALLCTFVVIWGLFEFLYRDIEALVNFGGFIALLTFLILFPFTAIYTRVLTTVLCTSGLALFISSGTLSSQVFGGFVEMVPMVSLLASVSFLGLVVELGGFADLFQRFYTNAKRLYQSYLFSLIISYMLSFLSLSGAIAPLYHLIFENLKRIGLQKGQRFVTTSILRGYAMAISITPVSATVGIALQYSGLSWMEMASPVFLLSLFGLFLAFFLEMGWIGKSKIIINPEPNVSTLQKDSGGNGNIYRKSLSFLIFFIGVISCIFFLENIMHFSSLNSISMGCLLAILIWSFLNGFSKQLFTCSSSFLSKGFLHLSDQFTLLLAAGFFTFSMELNGGLEWLGYFVEAAVVRIGITAVLVVVPVLIIFLSFIGVHPFASGVIIASTITVSSYNFDPLCFAVAIISGISMGVVISPFSAVILILSSLSEVSPYKAGFRWNILFIIGFLILTTFSIILMKQ